MLTISQHQHQNTYAIVLCTCGSEHAANTLAQQLVELNLAACVNILPNIRSVYKWQGKVEIAQETQLIIKTLVSKFHLLESAIKQHHDYDVPEIIMLPVEGGSDDYLSWINQSLDTNTVDR
ncbi:divalent-cation tolerance protein CutA [Flocculibacter collagenilyticus]|uniref:divalent-cation tolerance protein CutA n=1 Tax=Flocculibacter collagenilyticus TaxID=2744479 RepID=UPI0018F46009|nr:divalent-cation tolerance protein CutA [Flocculibacter collagenilyticus]